MKRIILDATDKKDETPSKIEIERARKLAREVSPLMRELFLAEEKKMQKNNFGGLEYLDFIETTLDQKERQRIQLVADIDILERLKRKIGKLPLSPEDVANIVRFQFEG